MALRWTAAGMQEAAKGFRRLKAYRQLPQLRAALAAHQSRHVTNIAIEPKANAAYIPIRQRPLVEIQQRAGLAMTDEEIGRLAVIARSRSESASRVERAQMLLAYRQKRSFFAVGQELGQHHQTVQRCVERALAYGPLAALDDRPRPGKEPAITPEAKAWLVSVACDKAREHGYPHELWTTRLLARHARERGPAVGHECLASLVQGTVCKILGQEDIKPHKVRYYLERRDAEFEQKMARRFCVSIARSKS
jgi:hypothetical protein